MPYWKLFYHVVWSTRNREPLLTPDTEPTVQGLLRGKVSRIDSFPLFAIPAVRCVPRLPNEETHAPFIHPF